MVADDLLAEVTGQIGSRREAIWILDHVTSRLADPHEAAAEIRRLSARRAQGEPLQYVLGTWAFRSLDLTVTPAVLIPRPETEQLVDAVLARLVLGMPDVTPFRICDLGTGSGAIGLSLVSEVARSDCELWCTDESAEALAVAKQNAEALGVEAHFVEGSWFDALEENQRGSFSVLVSNPPYVAERDRASLDPVLGYEPETALFSPDSAEGIAGFADTQLLIRGAGQWLVSRGVLALEMAEAHVAPACLEAEAAGFVAVSVFEDLAGKERGIVAQWP